MKRNPKQEGSILYDCIPQSGPCPNNCNQCYYNRLNAFYLPIDRPHFPTLEEVGDGIVRVNSGHDSNIDRDYVIRSTCHYPKRFFNTSIPCLDFPDPVVFTANREEEKDAFVPNDFPDVDFDNLMFVRLRVSTTNIIRILHAAYKWSWINVPVVLTFMRYYDEKVFMKQHSKAYEKRTHIRNTYWCPTEEYIHLVEYIFQDHLVDIEICRTYCKNCLNCARFYYKAKERVNAKS